MAAMPQIRAGIARLQQARATTARNADARAAAVQAEAHQRCQDSRSRIEKLRGIEKNCNAPAR